MPSKGITISDYLRHWGLPENKVKAGKNGLRYANPLIKGVYWYYFSMMRRKQDYDQYGVCITCLRPVSDWREADAGHIVPSRECGVYLQFHPKNVHLQCKRCNNPYFTPDAGFHNAINLDKRYGLGTSQELYALKMAKQREYSVQWYEGKTIEAIEYLGLSTIPAFVELRSHH